MDKYKLSPLLQKIWDKNFKLTTMSISEDRKKNIKSLIDKQNKHFNFIKNNFSDPSTACKTSHYIWYVCPTTKEGDSEGPPKTSIKNINEAIYLLNNCDCDSWTTILDRMADSIQKQGLYAGRDKNCPIPKVDHGRIVFFNKEWGEYMKTIPDLANFDKKEGIKKFNMAFNKFKDAFNSQYDKTRSGR